MPSTCIFNARQLISSGPSLRRRDSWAGSARWVWRGFVLRVEYPRRPWSTICRFGLERQSGPTSESCRVASVRGRVTRRHEEAAANPDKRLDLSTHTYMNEYGISPHLRHPSSSPTRNGTQLILD